MNDMPAPEIVRLTLWALDAHPGADPAELVSILRANGVPQADRAVALVPVAFGRQLLDGMVAASPSAIEDGREIVLAEDPIFAAAAWIARTAEGSAAVLPVGMRSAEVHVVNDAMHRGSKPEDLVLAPPVLA